MTRPATTAELAEALAVRDLIGSLLPGVDSGGLAALKPSTGETSFAQG